GKSFWSLLQHNAYIARTEVYAEKTFHTYYEPMRAVRGDHHKLVVNFEVSTRVDVPTDIRQSPIYPLMQSEFDDVRPPVELYDLGDDRWERHNLAGSAEYADVESDLLLRLRDWMRSTRDPLLDGPVASPYYTDVRALLGER